jgi:hypothetical protein
MRNVPVDQILRFKSVSDILPNIQTPPKPGMVDSFTELGPEPQGAASILLADPEPQNIYKVVNFTPEYLKQGKGDRA